MLIIIVAVKVILLLIIEVGNTYNAKKNLMIQQKWKIGKYCVGGTLRFLPLFEALCRLNKYFISSTSILRFDANGIPNDKFYVCHFQVF